MAQSRRLLVVCQVFYPDTTSTSQLFSPLLAEMAKRGWDIEVLCGYPATQQHSELPRKEVWNGIKIRRCGFKVPLKKNLFNRGLAYSAFLVQAGWRLMVSERDQQWFGVTNPPFVAWILGFTSWLKQRSFTYMFLDLHPEGIVALGDLNENAWYVKAWMRLNGKAYRRAEKLIILGRDMSPILEKNYQISRTPIYLPHWSGVETDLPVTFHESEFTQKLNLSDKFVVQYSGNMGLWHDMETFVRAAKKLEHLPHIQFVFIGGGIRKAGAVKLAEELAVKNILWQDFVPIQQLTESLAACHVSLISLNKGLEGVAVPSKLYGILASARAVVAQVPVESEVAYTIAEHKCGVVIRPGDVDALAAELEELSKNPDSVNKMGENAFTAYKNHYQLAQARAALEKIL